MRGMNIGQLAFQEVASNPNAAAVEVCFLSYVFGFKIAENQPFRIFEILVLAILPTGIKREGYLYSLHHFGHAEAPRYHFYDMFLLIIVPFQ